MPSCLVPHGPNVHDFFLFRDVVENPKLAHAQFPNRQFMFKRWRQINKAFSPSSRNGRPIAELLTNLNKNAPLVERPDRFQLLDREFVHHNLVTHGSMITPDPAYHTTERLGKKYQKR